MLKGVKIYGLKLKLKLKLKLILKSKCNNKITKNEWLHNKTES